MTVKIAVIGAGGVIFARKMVTDILLDPYLCRSEIALMDIDAGRLQTAFTVGQKIAKSLNIDAKITATTDLTTAVKNADFVITLFRVGTLDHAKLEYEIPKKYGVDQVVGDSMNPGGIFRGLRTLKALFEVVDAMERHCPGAYLLNYVNPMSINTIALSRRAKSVKVVGLCHSVVNTVREISQYLQIDPATVRYRCAGVNHQAFMLNLSADGQDLYPALRRAMDNPEIYQQDKVRFELFRHFGYFVTESSGHNSEYSPYFRKRRDILDQVCSHQPPAGGAIDWRQMSDGISGASIKILPELQKQNDAEIAHLLAADTLDDLKTSDEYAIQIIAAIVGNVNFAANLNVINHGLIPSLPPEACVEVPCLVNGGGIQPCRIDNYPEQLAGLNRMMINAQLLAADGALTCDCQKIRWAITLDPLTAAVCSLTEIRQMTNELFAALASEIAPGFGQTPSIF